MRYFELIFRKLGHYDQADRYRQVMDWAVSGVHQSQSIIRHDNMTDFDELEKLTDDYLRVVEAKAKAKDKKKRKGTPSWSEKKPKNLANALMGGKEHPFAACVKKMKGKVETPEAFCAKLKDVHKGSTKWRSEERKKNESKKK